MGDFKEKLQVKEAAMPDGGGAYTSIGEEFQVDGFTGSPGLSIPVFATPSRGWQPGLQLEYSISEGSGMFGLGFSMNLAYIKRSTNKCIPLYDDDKDIFISSQFGELTAAGSGVYVPVRESDFPGIRHIKEAGQDYWEIIQADNSVALYGTGADSTAAGDGLGIFQWMLAETSDVRGNRSSYTYERDGGSCFLSEVYYGNYKKDDGTEGWCFKLEFIYGDETDGEGSWGLPYCTSYRSGFPVMARRLCREIKMIHLFDGTGQTVRSTVLEYDIKDRIPLLKKVYQKSGPGSGPELSLPPISMEYSIFTGNQAEVRELRPKVGIFTEPFDTQGLHFIDLYGEGLAGMLYCRGNSLLYYEPLGDGIYGPAAEAESFPTDRNLEQEEYTLESVEGGGKYALKVESGNRCGIYPLKNGRFEAFIPFERYPADHKRGDMETADLQGDGLIHPFCVQDGQVCYYPSRGREGTENIIYRQAPQGFPALGENNASCLVTPLDWFGDGLEHRVRVQDGRVECWPNLGYGRFGEKITVRNAPVLEELDVSRLYFADIDGSGTQDLIYAWPDRVMVWRNLGGWEFAHPLAVGLPETYTSQDKIDFADISGAGYKSIVFSKAGIQQKQYWLDLNRGQKPWMLVKLENNLGCETRINYTSSVSCYLEDKRKGRDWKYRPPFPVQTVSEIEQKDSISGLSVLKTYAYRDGCYDINEKRFLGFGYAEISQSEQCGISGEHIQGALHRYWYYTGEEDILAAQAYFWEHDALAYKMPDPEVEAGPSGEYGQAHLVLGGRIRRHEVYAVGAQDKADMIPHMTEACSYKVIKQCEGIKGHKASWQVIEKEHIEYTYDGTADDPRAVHTFALAWNEYGQVLRGLTAAYPRRKQSVAGQGLPRVSLKEYGYISRLDRARLLGVPFEEKLYELNGFWVREEGLTYVQALEQAEGALAAQIPYGQEFCQGKLQARLESWQRLLYWDELGEADLPAGRAGGRGLVHHMEEAVLPVGLTGSLAEGGFSDAWEGDAEGGILENKCGCFLRDGYWWRNTPVLFYGERDYYQVIRQEYISAGEGGGLYARTAWDYDMYALLPVRKARWVEQGTELIQEFHIDYRVMQYDSMADENGNCQEALYDGLGVMTASFCHGITMGREEGSGPLGEYERKEGALNDVLLNPAVYIQNARTSYYYDLHAYEDRKGPAVCVALENKDSLGGRISIGISYFDGFMRTAQEKQQCGKRYLVKGCTVYNADGKTVSQGQPYWSDGPEYESPGTSPVVFTAYDALGRVIKVVSPSVELPDGTGASYFTSTEYHPWEMIFHSGNNNSTKSEYYRRFMEQYPQQPTQRQKDLMDGLLKAAASEGRPRREALDVNGAKCLDYCEEGLGTVAYHYDIKGKLVRAAGSDGHTDISFLPDMVGQEYYARTGEGGPALSLHDVYGQQAYTMDARGCRLSYGYDSLGRLCDVRDHKNRCLHQYLYGEKAENARDKNLAGQLWKRHGQDGEYTVECRGIHSGLVDTSMRFCSEYKSAPDWGVQEGVPLEEECYREHFEYDLGGRVISHTGACHDRTVYEYDARDNISKAAVSVYAQDGAGWQQKISCTFEYSAGNQEEEAVYGNGIKRRVLYDKYSRQMMGVRAVKKDRSLIQSVDYSYDLAGNITRIRDNLAERTYSNNQEAEGVWDYTYDVKNRLVRATGREMPQAASACADIFRIKKKLPHVNDFQGMEQYREEYTYDLGGNMTSIAHHAPSVNWSRKMETEEGSNRLIKAGSLQIKYDKAGYPVKLNSPGRLVWDEGGALRQAEIIPREGEESDSEYYVYGTDGERTRKVRLRKTAAGMEKTETLYLGGVERKRIWKESVLILERASLHVMTGSGRPAAVYDRWLLDKYHRETDRASLLRYQLTDQRYSVCCETDEAGEVITAEEFYPFGETAVSFGSRYQADTKPYRYCNKEKDTATGFYCHGARYYSGLLCRFLSPDPLVYMQEDEKESLNRYVYCRNNPVVYMDPDGHDIYIIEGGHLVKNQRTSPFSPLARAAAADGDYCNKVNRQCREQAQQLRTRARAAWAADKAAFNAQAAALEAQARPVHILGVHDNASFEQAWNSITNAPGDHHQVIFRIHGGSSSGRLMPYTCTGSGPGLHGNFYNPGAGLQQKGSIDTLIMFTCHAGQDLPAGRAAGRAATNAAATFIPFAPNAVIAAPDVSVCADEDRQDIAEEGGNYLMTAPVPVGAGAAAAVPARTAPVPLGASLGTNLLEKIHSVNPAAVPVVPVLRGKYK